jgi:hypothetical protein
MCGVTQGCAFPQCNILKAAFITLTMFAENMRVINANDLDICIPMSRDMFRHWAGVKRLHVLEWPQTTSELCRVEH